MARTRRQPNEEVEQRLIDKRFETWLSAQEIAEIRAIVFAPWTEDGSARLEEMGADLCLYCIARGCDDPERDVLRALGRASAKRRRAALRAHAATLGEWPHELEERLRQEAGSW